MAGPAGNATGRRPPETPDTGRRVCGIDRKEAERLARSRQHSAFSPDALSWNAGGRARERKRAMKQYLAIIAMDIKLALRLRAVIFFNYLFPLIFLFHFCHVAGTLRLERRDGLCGDHVRSLLACWAAGSLGPVFAPYKSANWESCGVTRSRPLLPAAAGGINGHGLDHLYSLHRAVASHGAFIYHMPLPTRISLTAGVHLARADRFPVTGAGDCVRGKHHAGRHHPGAAVLFPHDFPERRHFPAKRFSRSCQDSSTTSFPRHIW